MSIPRDSANPFSPKSFVRSQLPAAGLALSPSQAQRGTLSIVPVEQETAAAWLTIDPAHDDLIQRVAGNDVFALVRTKSNESTPFALVRKGRFLKKSHVVHLVPGLPEDDAG